MGRYGKIFRTGGEANAIAIRIAKPSGMIKLQYADIMVGMIGIYLQTIVME